MNNSTKNWYILCTKAGCEKKVSNFLTRKNVENYFPLKRQVLNKKKVVMEPLFPSYVFVQIEESNLINIRMTNGVINFAYWLGKPAIIRNEEIDVVKQFLNAYSTVKLEKTPFNTTAADQVSNDDKSDYIVSVKNNIIKMVLPSMGYAIIAEADKANADVINTKKPVLKIIEKFQFAQ